MTHELSQQKIKLLEDFEKLKNLKSLDNLDDIKREQEIVREYGLRSNTATGVYTEIRETIAEVQEMISDQLESIDKSYDKRIRSAKRRKTYSKKDKERAILEVNSLRRHHKERLVSGVFNLVSELKNLQTAEDEVKRCTQKLERLGMKNF